ncbi:MAG: lytic transglycosylase domain-containing protein [archaeon]
MTGLKMRLFMFRLNNLSLVFLLIFGMSFGMAFSNPSNNWQSNQPTFDNLYAGDFSNYWPILSDMKDGQCNATTDFVIGIPPGGCSPSVVTSDLLSEQNVPVFCQLYAIKVNPLIKVSSIKLISFKGDYPEGVRSIVYHPARAAIKSYSTLIGEPTLENIGYVVIVLKQEKVEANMSEWVFGNLTATMTYDAEEAYGTGAGDYYLEPMSDDEWAGNYVASSFWNGRGYLRVLSVGDGAARIQIMGDADKVLRTLNLKEGETSSSSYLPGFYCKAGLKVKLTDITTQEDMALLNVDGSNIWVRKGSKFLDGKCSVSKLVVRGNNDGEVTIKCNGAGVIAPLALSGGSVVFKIVSGEAENEIRIKVGGKVAQDYYLSYVGKYPKGVNEDEREIVILTKGINSVKKMANIYVEVNKLVDNKETEMEFTGTLRAWMKAQGVDGFILDRGQYDNGVTFFEVDNVLEDESSDDYFDKSVYIVRDELVEDYGSEEKEIGGTWAEEALYEEIVLAGKLGNYMTQKGLMDLFLERYPLAASASYVSDMRAKMYGTDYSKSFVNVYVGDEFKSISVVDFKAVGEGEKTVDLKVGPNFYSGLNESDNVSLPGNVGIVNILKIEPGKISVRFYSKIERASGVDRSRSAWIGEDARENFAGVDFYVEDIRVNQVAHISLIPDVKHDKSEADFSFRIGVEKRAIELSPEKATEMIKNLNVSIAKLEGIVDRLGNVVTGLKGACFATSAVLMIKNMATGFSGEAAARTKVMVEYKKICDTDYPDMTRTECYNELSDKIDADVVAMTGVLAGVNSKMEGVQTKYTGDGGGIFGGEGINNADAYREDLKKQISSSEIEINVGTEKVMVPVSELDSVSQVRAVLTWEEARGKGIIEAVAKADMDDALRNVALAWKGKAESKLIAGELNNKWGVSNMVEGDVALLTNAKTQYYQWSGKTGRDYGLTGEDANKNVQAAGATVSNSYLVVLGSKTEDGKMGVEKVMSKESGSWIKINTPVELKNVAFLSSGTGDSCSNTWIKGTAKISYYEAGDNKGLPAIVPFDLNNGWYAMVSNSGGTYIDSSPQGYTASADVKYFKICNIGSNKLMQSGTGDDLCQSFDVNTVGVVDKFIPCPNMESGDVSALYGKAREAIKKASQQYGEKSVNIFDEIISVGAPMSAVGGFECQDFMSPSDCKIMFNVCDPVICPPSRCNLGGKFPVADVIQTGIIGSLVLCLPNAKEGIYFPICLSGVQAGLDAYLSILKSERDCLEHSLESGELVGICDQITSIYKCEFFWRQLSPLMDQLIPGVVDYAISGGRVRGGGEYAFVEQSWNTMKQSVSFFKDVYAQNAFKAFNIRSTQEIGSAVCKSFVGTSVPGSANFIENLLAPESPTQFYAQFSEQLFTEATIPSTSQYKVYYHIYAGNDAGVQYKVYLRDPPQTSYYASSPEVSVKSGYIAAGSSADESIDFTAPSGYKELCVVVNAQEECGFKQVTTDFGLDWVSMKYTEEQALQEDITSEKECISGTPSALSMATLNLQAGAEEVLNPEIALRGIVRICASTNPDAGVVSGKYVACSKDSDCGTGFSCNADLGNCVDKAGSGTIQTSGSRWKDVGYCGDSSLRCWLDVDSVKDDLESLEVISGESISVLDERRGLINNTRLGLEGVASLLSKARADIKALTISKNEFAGLNITYELDKVIGTNDAAGAGTNGDRAEALSLKASVYRLLVGQIKEAEVEKVEEPRSDLEDINNGIEIEDKIENVTGKENEEFTDFGGTGSEGESEVGPDADLVDIIRAGIDAGILDEDCEQYVSLVRSTADKYSEFDELMLFALMQRESSCNPDAQSSSSYGLMQISSFEMCSEIGVGGIDDVRGVWNVAKNIECGALILSKKYSSNSKRYACRAFTSSKQNEPEVSMLYSGIEYALRGYNGWGCAGIRSDGSEIFADHDYVEKVLETYNGLKGIGEEISSNIAIGNQDNEEFFFSDNGDGRFYYSSAGCDDFITAAVIREGEVCPLYKIYISRSDGFYDVMLEGGEKSIWSFFTGKSEDLLLGRIDIASFLLVDKSEKADEVFGDFGISEEKFVGDFRNWKIEDIGLKLYDIISAIEMEEDPSGALWIRTKVISGSGSTAYGPVQLTKGLAEGYLRNNAIDWTENEKEYLVRFIDQGWKFLAHGKMGPTGFVDAVTIGKNKAVYDRLGIYVGDRYDARYDYGGSGELTSDEDKKMYKQVVLKMLIEIYLAQNGDLDRVWRDWRFGREKVDLSIASLNKNYVDERYRKLFGEKIVEFELA